MKTVLASGSPRRKEILENAGYEFTVVKSDADETLPCSISPEAAVEYLAAIKGEAAAKDYYDCLIISADTVVACDGDILGKPKDEAQAAQMLSMLSGRTHSVYTGVCVRYKNRRTVFSEKTDVTFYKLSEDEINQYVATGEPLDKAGAYGIQGKGALLVKKIDGDYLNVVGLPLAKLARVVKSYIG